MSIILVRLAGSSSWSYGSSLAAARHCRLDPSSSQHGAYVDDEGVFHYQHIDAAAGTSTSLLRFQLQFQAAEGLPYEPISKPWAFEFVPGAPGDLLLVQEGSCRILYASLPKQGADSSDVFLFGSHTAPVRCLRTNGNAVFSGCERGVLKLWSLADGQLTDTVRLPDGSSVTAITSLGPLLVAVGSSSSTVTLYDVASGRLLAVQRLMAGPGTVECMAAWLPQQVLAAASLAPGGPLPPDGGGVLAGGAWSDAQLQQLGVEAEVASGYGPKALLAVVSGSGWLCVFGAEHASGQPWSLIHSSGGLVASGVQAQLAFSPDGTTLAVSSPVAQLLGTGAVALASLGAQPGAVSLYGVSRSGVGLSALLPPLLLQQQGQQQQLPELRLWHQWSLSSTPVGLFVLPSSGLELLQGKQLQPAQVLHLYVVPEVGPPQVLKAQHRPTTPVHSSPQRVQQPTALSEARLPVTVPLRASAATGGSSAGGAAGAAGSSSDGGSSSGRSSDGGSSSGRSSGGGSSSAASQQGDTDEALLLNIAERDLAEVARAIAAAAGPVLDAELEALLLGATGTAVAGAADVTAEEVAAAAAAGAEAAGASAPAASTGLGSQQQEQQQPGPGVQASAPPADVLPAVDGGENEGEAAGGAVRLPQTLPGVRSWRSRLDQQGPRDGPSDLTALAAALHEEQERLRRQQQQQQEQQEEAAAWAGSAATAHAVRKPPTGTEQELPSESSFQHLLPPEQGHPPSQQQQEHQQQEEMGAGEAAQEQQQDEAATSHSQPAGGAGTADTAAAAAAATPTLRVPAAAAAAAASPTLRVPAAAAAAAATPGVARALPAGPEHEPQPRQLPAMLRSQRLPAAAVLRDASAPAGSALAGGALGDRPSSRGAGSGPGQGRAAADRQTAAAAEDSSVAQQQHQQQQLEEEDWLRLQEQQRAKREVGAQQPVGRLSVKERLSLRRQEALQKQQQQQAAREAGGSAIAAAAVRGCAAGGARGDQGLGAAAAFLPPSDRPLAVAVQNSSRLLAAKIQEAERAPDVTVDPAGPAALKLAAARLADLDLSPEEQQYCYQDLPGLKDVPTPTHAPRLVPKQLDAHWVAQRSRKPCMDTLFRPQDWQQGFVDPQVLLLPAWPSPQQVVQQLLWPGQRPGVWT